MRKVEVRILPPQPAFRVVPSGWLWNRQAAALLDLLPTDQLPCPMRSTIPGITAALVAIHFVILRVPGGRRSNEQ